MADLASALSMAAWHGAQLPMRATQPQRQSASQFQFPPRRGLLSCQRLLCFRWCGAADLLGRVCAPFQAAQHINVSAALTKQVHAIPWQQRIPHPPQPDISRPPRS